MTSKRKLLFSVTAKDCRFKAFTGSGPGGQHRNKVATAIRCVHEPSGAVGTCTTHKSQHRNKKVAFGRMARSDKFQRWVRLEAARQTGALAEIERKVDRDMQPDRIRWEHREDGVWVGVEAAE